MFGILLALLLAILIVVMIIVVAIVLYKKRKAKPKHTMLHQDIMRFANKLYRCCVIRSDLFKEVNFWYT